MANFARMRKMGGPLAFSGSGIHYLGMKAMKSLFNVQFIVLLFAVLLTTPVYAAELPAVTHDGLQLVPSKEVQVLYVRPGASLAGYKNVAIADCYVAFRKNWQRDKNSGSLNRVSKKDMERIKRDLAELFRTTFNEELQKGSYNVVTQIDDSDDDVLILKPALVDLDVVAPDTMSTGRSKTFSTSSGSMTLYLEVYDGATGEILARIIDPQQARDEAFMRWQNSITNRREATRMIDKWARLARQALDRARQQMPGEGAGR